VTLKCIFGGFECSIDAMKILMEEGGRRRAHWALEEKLAQHGPMVVKVVDRREKSKCKCYTPSGLEAHLNAI
jgi:hypothetical protein